MAKRSPQQTVTVVDPLADLATTPADTEPTPADTEPVPDANVRPIPEAELTPDQRRIRQLEDQLARERGVKDPEQELDTPTTPGANGNIVIHVVEDGFTALGRVWYRGQEIEFEVDSQAYKDTCDRSGRSWLDVRSDEAAQFRRWRKVMFRSGPWPGAPMTAGVGSFKPLRAERGNGKVSSPTAQELEAAERAEQARGRAAPRLPTR